MSHPLEEARELPPFFKELTKNMEEPAPYHDKPPYPLKEWPIPVPAPITSIRVRAAENGFILAVEPTKNDPLGLVHEYPFVFISMEGLLDFIKSNLRQPPNDVQGRKDLQETNR